MPPRQPLKLKPRTPRKVVSKPKSSDVAALAAQLLEEAPPAPKPAKPGTPVVAPARSSFSPYPDLTMAIAMLMKRQQAAQPDSERGRLISRWLDELRAMQADMQKLHKLEQLANRLKPID